MFRRCRLMVLVVMIAAPAAFAQRGGPPPAPEPNPNGPLYRATGEQYRVYDFPGTGESIPYRLFVPSSWTPNSNMGMLVTLRAGNSVNNNHREGNDLVRVGEERGYIVISPLGYRPLRQPYYNSPYPVIRPGGPSVPGDGWTDEDDLRAEQDVMYVIDLVAAEYNADRSRVFIHGQNPSGSGALYLAATYPDRFAGAVISSGPIVTDGYPFDRLADADVPLMIIHGDQDTSNPIEASQALAAAARAAGVETVYATVPGGQHLTAYLDFAEEIYDFLDAH